MSFDPQMNDIEYICFDAKIYTWGLCRNIWTYCPMFEIIGDTATTFFIQINFPNIYLYYY